MKIIDLNDYKNIESRGNCQNLFNSYEWLNVINKTYDLTIKLVANNSNTLFFPYCLTKDAFYQSIVSIPFGDYILNSCPKEWLCDTLSLLKKNYPHNYIKTSIVNKSFPNVSGFVATKKGILIQINIQRWSGSNHRNKTYERNIKNASHFGLTVRISNSFESVKEFYNLHQQLRVTKFKKLPQPFRFFNNIYDEFIAKDKGFILETWARDILIASWFILIHNEVLYYKFGSSDPNYLHLRPNDLLFRSLVQYGSDNDFKIIDLGYSGIAKSYEGLIRFKSKEGGDKLPIYHVEYFPPGFDKDRLEKKQQFLAAITREAVASGNLSEIKRVSDNYYGRFA